MQQEEVLELSYLVERLQRSDESTLERHRVSQSLKSQTYPAPSSSSTSEISDLADFLRKQRGWKYFFLSL